MYESAGSEYDIVSNTPLRLAVCGQRVTLSHLSITCSTFHNISTLKFFLWFFVVATGQHFGRIFISIDGRCSIQIQLVLADCGTYNAYYLITEQLCWKAFSVCIRNYQEVSVVDKILLVSHIHAHTLIHCIITMYDIQGKMYCNLESSSQHLFSKAFPLYHNLII